MTDWKKKTVEQWEHINRAAVRRFGDSSLAEEAALAVMDGLEANDWQRLRVYSGKASFSSFVSFSVFSTGLLSSVPPVILPPAPPFSPSP